MPRYWWVNQNQTYRYEVVGGFLWSPKWAAGGRNNYFYNTMTQVRSGDVIFSYYDTKIQAVGVVQRRAVTAPKPEGFGNTWNTIGWLVEVDFLPVVTTFRPKNHMRTLAPLLRSKYAPIRASGDGLQGVYLTEIDAHFADALLELAGMSDVGSLAELLPLDADDSDDSGSERAFEPQSPKVLEGELEREQITKARRGQGVFKLNVRLIESRCRLTGVTSKRHLIASHIKPWSKSDDSEKLDGANGLLLSPHVDHLFDRGMISFRDDGTIIRSPILDVEVLQQWSLDSIDSAGSFSKSQASYLEYHRDKVLRSKIPA